MVNFNDNKNMKWKYKNDENDEVSEASQGTLPIIINTTTEGQGFGSNIKITGNRIFYYSDIEESQIAELNKILFDMDMKAQGLKTVVGENYDPVINLHLNTFGGSIFAAFSTVDTIKRMKSKVHTYIDGSVASAGTLISSVGAKRFMGEHAHLLIHQLSSGVYGKFSEMEDEIFNCTHLMKMLKEFYKKNTKIPMKKLDELMSRDIWLTAKECKEYGFIDEIL